MSVIASARLSANDQPMYSAEPDPPAESAAECYADYLAKNHGGRLHIVRRGGPHETWIFAITVTRGTLPAEIFASTIVLSADDGAAEAVSSGFGVVIDATYRQIAESWKLALVVA